MTPLLVSLAVQLEPVLGPALGWAAGVAAAPGLFTWIGGTVVLLATLGATLATARRQQQEQEAEAEAADRRLLKNKSMRLVSSDDAGGDDMGGQSVDVGGVGVRGGGRGSNSSYYAALVAAEEAAVDDVDVRRGLEGVKRVQHKGWGLSGAAAEGGDVDVIVSEHAQLLPSGAHLSHHHKPSSSSSDHTEIELPALLQREGTTAFRSS